MPEPADAVIVRVVETTNHVETLKQATAIELTEAGSDLNGTNPAHQVRSKPNATPRPLEGTVTKVFHE